MSPDVPIVRRVYQSHSLDSRRWAFYVPRDGDIIVASSYKSGTTWSQMILLQLILGDIEHPPIMETSPWLESPLAPIEQVTATLEAQRHRRVIKTHLPLDGLPYHRNVGYIVVCRDPRDVFMSLWNHYRNIVRYPFLAGPSHPRRQGPPLPRCPDDIRQFWRDWLTRGWFDWESEGYPFWSNLRHTQTWWDWRHLPNIRFVHFNDLLGDLGGEISAIASYLGLAMDFQTLKRVTGTATFESMRQNGDRLLPAGNMMLLGGAATFFNKGTNGRWLDVLTDDDLALYRQAAQRELSDSCRRWLELGREASPRAHLGQAHGAKRIG